MRRAKTGGGRKASKGRASRTKTGAETAGATNSDAENSEANQPQKPVILEDLRKAIKDKVGNKSADIVEGLIQEAVQGHCTQAKYLFEIIGLYPHNAGEEQPGGETMVSTLLKRLGVPEKTAVEENSREGEEHEVLAGTVK